MDNTISWKQTQRNLGVSSKASTKEHPGGQYASNKPMSRRDKIRAGLMKRDGRYTADGWAYQVLDNS